jgi:hypothetical protein
MKKSLLLAALLALPFAVVTAADAPAKPKRDQSVIFKAIDQNADGSLSFDEYKASTAGHVDPSRVSDLFKKKDADGDGKLTLSEFSFVPPQEAPKPAFAGENKKQKKEKSADEKK